MRIISLKIYEAEGCGNLLDGLTLSLDRAHSNDGESFSALCLVGSNGSGKSQFLQVVAEIFQDAWHTHAPGQERAEPNRGLNFELIYEMVSEGLKSRSVKLSRVGGNKRRAVVQMELLDEGKWSEVSSTQPLYGELLPPIIVGYSSGDNETLSLPFFKSRAAYAKDVSSAALSADRRTIPVPDNRLLLIDYGTNLEVLIASLMLGSEDVCKKVLEHASLARLASWRCVIQLAPPTISRTKPINGRVGVKLTIELEQILAKLRSCSTCEHQEIASDTYTLDFFNDAHMRAAFQFHWGSASELYRAFHKFSMLNDLAVPKKVRSRLANQMKRGNFATRLPEPQDEHKVFRFEEVKFHSNDSENRPIDYVALSDGEHQQAQVFGVFSMINEPNALFLLDEPESHFNPQWRLKFISRLRSIPAVEAASREVILTSHAPFVPSDMPREHVLIFRRTAKGVEARNPRSETFGASFDRILKDCFDVDPPISQVARDKIQDLKEGRNVREIEEALPTIGSSVEKAFLIDHLNQMKLGEE